MIDSCGECGFSTTPLLCHGLIPLVIDLCFGAVVSFSDIDSAPVSVILVMSLLVSFPSLSKVPESLAPSVEKGSVHGRPLKMLVLSSPKVLKLIEPMVEYGSVLLQWGSGSRQVLTTLRGRRELESALWLDPAFMFLFPFLLLFSVLVPREFCLRHNLM